MAEKKIAWTQRPWARVFLAILLAQGLYFGFRKLFTAGIMASQEGGGQGAQAILQDLLLTQGLQMIALAFGCALAGAGQRYGVIIGAVVGAWNGVLSVFLLEPADHAPTAVSIYGLPLVHSAFGALAGLIGSSVWRPLPPQQAAVTLRSPKLETGPASNVTFRGPIAWFRVLLGALLAVGGTFFARKILHLVTEASEGKLTTDSYLQAELITWEIRALAVFLGSTLSAYSTRNSLKQGFAVGVIVALAQMAGILGGTAMPSVEQNIISIGCALALGILGGWFGGQLFPPSQGTHPRGALRALPA
jgi:hypothetical protein